MFSTPHRMNRDGFKELDLGTFRNRDNGKQVNMQFGFIQINLTDPEAYTNGLKISP